MTQVGTDISVGQNSIQVLAGTTVGAAAYILVYAKSQGVTPSVPALTELRDWALPVGDLMSLEFIDMSVEKGLVSGRVTVGHASFGDELTNYVCFWGDSAKDRLGAAVGEALALLPVVENATTLSYTLAVTTYPAWATHILVFAQSDEGIAGTSTAVKLVDRFLPTAMPAGIRFLDIDSNHTEIGGLVTLLAAQTVEPITHYLLYYGNGSPELDDVVPGPIGSVLATEGRLEILVQLDTIPPPGATHLLAFSANEVGTMGTGMHLRVHDVVSPSVPPAVSFFDTNGEAGLIAGAVVVPRPGSNANTAAIDFYIGREACLTVLFLGTVYLNATGSDTCASPFWDEMMVGCFVPEGAQPHGTTTVLAFARNDDGVQPICSESRLNDRAVPVRPALNITFVDTDPALRFIGGSVTVEHADVEVNITEYVVYFGAMSTKLEGHPAVFASAKEDLWREHNLVPQGTEVPAAATHLIAFSANSDGESLECVFTLLVDEVGTIQMQSTVNIDDTIGTLTPEAMMEVDWEIGKTLSDLFGLSSGAVVVVNAGLIEQRRLQDANGLRSIRLTFTVTVVGGEPAARVQNLLDKLRVKAPQTNATEPTPREHLEQQINALLQKHGVTASDQNLTVYGGEPSVVSEHVGLEAASLGNHTGGEATASVSWMFGGFLSFITTIMSATVCFSCLVKDARPRGQELDKQRKYCIEDDVLPERDLHQPDEEPDTFTPISPTFPNGMGQDDEMWIAEDEGVLVQLGEYSSDTLLPFTPITPSMHIGMGDGDMLCPDTHGIVVEPDDEDELWIADGEGAMTHPQPYTDKKWRPDIDAVPRFEDAIDDDDMWRPEPEFMQEQAGSQLGFMSVTHTLHNSTLVPRIQDAIDDDNMRPPEHEFMQEQGSPQLGSGRGLMPVTPTLPDSKTVPRYEDAIDDDDDMWRPEPEFMQDQASPQLGFDRGLMRVSPTSIGCVGFDPNPTAVSPLRLSMLDFVVGNTAVAERIAMAADDRWHPEAEEPIPDCNEAFAWQPMPDEGVEDLPSTGQVSCFFLLDDFDDSLLDHRTPSLVDRCGAWREEQEAVPPGSGYRNSVHQRGPGSTFSSGRDPPHEF